MKNAYEQYLITNNFDVSKQPSIFEYLDINRISLSNFFANKTNSHVDTNFLPQANFINEIKNVSAIYSSLRRVYLGSIISSYLEHDYEDMKGNEIEFLLDSSFIINLLGLTSEGTNHTSKKILEICKRLKYKVSTLDITVEETQYVLNRRAQEFDASFLSRQIDPENIYNACERLHLTKTDLQHIASKLQKTLQLDYNVFIIHDTVKLQNKAKYSPIYSILKERKNNPDGALHDATAIYYVRERRKTKIHTFYESNCWFVTTSRQDFDLLKSTSNELTEMIKPEDLVNILWLSSPNINSHEIIEVGLTRLISGTISNSLPKPRVLKELDNNIQKYVKGNIEASDCARLARRIANRTITNLEDLNNTAREDPDKFVKLLNKEALKAKEEEEKNFKKTKELILKLKNQYESITTEKIKKREMELKENFNLELEKIQKEYLKGTELELQKSQKILAEQKTKIISENYHRLKNIKESLDKNAYTKINLRLYGFAFLYILIILTLIILTISLGWNTIEPYNYFFGIGYLAFTWSYFVITKREFNPKTIYSNMLKKKIYKNYELSNFDVDHFEKCKSEIDFPIKQDS